MADETTTTDETVTDAPADVATDSTTAKPLTQAQKIAGIINLMAVNGWTIPPELLV